MDEKGIHILKHGRVLNNRYIIEKVLGEGGFGITYKGMDRLLAVEVAIKEYFPQGFVTRNNVYSEQITITQMKYEDLFYKGKQKFLSEARILAKFNKEPGIVSVTDFFEENNTAYIVMEYLDGITLKNYMDYNGLISVNDIIGLMPPLMEALDIVHKAGLIHRDISPDNIMLLSNGGIKLMDFGAARMYTEFGQKSLSIMLKHGYAPEEQYRTHGVQGPWTDIYALSATIYKCITGITPVESLQRVLSDTLVPPSRLGVQIQPWQEYALMKGLSVRQEDRYQNIQEYCMDLYGDGSAQNYREPPYHSTSHSTSQTNRNIEKTVPYNAGGYDEWGDTRKQRKATNTIIAVLVGVASVFVIVVGLLLWQIIQQNNDNKQTASSTTATTAATTETTTESTVEKIQEPDTSQETPTEKKEQQTTEGKSEIVQSETQINTLPNVDNTSINTNACLTPSSYNILTSADSEFSFGYPKYMFNYSEVDDQKNSYRLSYEGSSDWLELYVYEEDNPGDPIKNAKKLYDQYVSECYDTYFLKEPKKVDETGMVRGLIGGKADASGETGSYIIAANDGKKNYILEFYYPDPDIEYDYDDINYVVDCVYRYCSFSGGTYKPRTYQQFLKDDMGTKK